MTGSRILVVGGTGMIGAHTAAHLAARGDRVTLSSRSAPSTDSLLPGIVGLPHLAGDYTKRTFTESDLSAFDSIVFAAGNDVRHVEESSETTDHWRRVQAEGVPEFVALAKRAGVGRVVQVGSCYHQASPELVEGSDYVWARREADERSRALTGDGFAAITINPPPIVGSIPGRTQRRFARMISWLRGERDEPLVAPAGGTNYLSARSLAQAVAGALDDGEPGRAYLVGDENLLFREYFQLFADVAGSTVVLEERDEEHPYQPDRFIVPGRGSVFAYEPPPEETALLGYDRHDIARALAEIVESVDHDEVAENKEGAA